MTLADLFPTGYLVAQAWRKWLNTEGPPFHSIDQLHEWRQNWGELVKYQGTLSGSLYVPEAFDRRATTILGFGDDPELNPLRSRFLWDNADNSLLREITADRRRIAQALAVGEYAAGLFVLTGWLRQGRLEQLLRDIVTTAPEPTQSQAVTPSQVEEAHTLTRDPLFMAVGMANLLLDEASKFKAECRQSCPTSDQELLNALPGILAEAKYYTCFVSYGQPDLAFAQKLRKDLEARGISCWLYDMDATPGERTWREIGRKRREADKMVVLCSAPALVSDGVLKEIEEQTDEDPDKMLPISLDDPWKERGFPVMRGDRDLKSYLLDKNYADFANLPYEEAMERLLRGLRRRDADVT